MSNSVEVTDAHRALALDIVGVLQRQYPNDDTLIVLILAVSIAVMHTGYPMEMLDNAIAILAQTIPTRGPCARAVLDVLADHMESHSG